MKQVDLHSLPPCSLSTDCLRLFDDLDEPGNTQFSFTEDIQDERLLDLLRLHLPGCPTCTAVLGQARHVHSQQRAMLRDFLIESEFAVPATILKIFAAIRHEEQTGPRPDTSEMTIY